MLEQQNFLKGGLGKLAEAAVTVDTLSAEAEKQRVVLKAKQAEADEALVHIQDSMLKAADRRKEVEVLKKRTAIEEVEMKERRVKVRGWAAAAGVGSGRRARWGLQSGFAGWC